MKEIQEEPAYSNAVIDLLKVAHEYCIYIEGSGTSTQEDVLAFAQRILPLLYLKGSLLPHITIDDNEANERFVTEEQWDSLFTLLREKLITIDEYWLLDYNGPDQTCPIKASISENLTDIYQDLKDFVILYQKTSRASKQNATFNCKHLFETHWGTKALYLTQYIHFLNYKDKNTETYSDFF
jgi:hypothetical protein